MSTSRLKPNDTSSHEFQFYAVNEQSRYFPVVKNAFEEIITPLYGDQRTFIDKIGESKDRKCELLFDKDTPVGLLVYKKQLQGGPNSIRNSFEVKTLILLDPKKNSNRGYDTLLIERVQKLARRMAASSIHLTVSSVASLGKKFFEQQGFAVVEEWKNKYVPNSTEYVMKRQVASNSHISTSSPFTSQAETSHSSACSSASHFKLTRRPQPTSVEESQSHRSEKRLERKREREDDEETSKEAYRVHPQKSSRRSDTHVISQAYPSYQSAISHTNTKNYSAASTSSLRHLGQSTAAASSYRSPSYPSASSSSSTSRGEIVNDTPYEVPKQHELTLKAKYIHQIRSGQKTVEGRINHGMALRCRKGDTIRFFYHQNPRDDVVCKITQVVRYNSFRDMLQACGVSRCLADVRNLEEGVRIYDAIPGYSQRAAQSGVLAIHLSLV